MIHKINLNINKNVEEVIKILNKHNFEAYLVGGATRDYLLNKVPKDFDITTNALPIEIKKIFNKYFESGIKHGTISIIYNEEIIEITTFRSEGKYLDSRRPSEVKFIKSLKKDLIRRDFTINALAYNKDIGLIDYFNGLEDLNNKIIKSIGSSKRRFKEDALRILRAIRFSAQLDFNIEINTFNAINSSINLLKNISIERIKDEVIKILMTSSKNKILLLDETKIINIILSRIGISTSRINDLYFDKYKSLINNLNQIDLNYLETLCIYFYSIFKYRLNINNIDKLENELNIILKNFKLSKKEIKFILTMIKYIDIDLNLLKDEYQLRKLISLLNKSYFINFLNIKKVLSLDLKSKENDINFLNELLLKFNFYIKNNYPFTLKEISINGNDLLSLGIKNKDIGIYLNSLLDYLLKNPLNNNRQYLLKLIKENL